MGIIKRGILGGFSKSVANVVGTSWKGIAVMKSKPLSVANPRSAGQTSQRTKFSSTVAVAQAILASILIPVWNGFASQMSGYNLFIQKNIADLFTGNGGLQPSYLNISPKAGTPSADFSATCNEGDLSVELSWTTTIAGTEQLDNDKSYAVVLNASGDVLAVGEPSITRASTSRILTLSEDVPAGNILHAYLAFVSADGKRTFTTQWFQLTVGA